VASGGWLSGRRYVETHGRKPVALVLHPALMKGLGEQAGSAPTLLDDVSILSSPRFEAPVLLNERGGIFRAVALSSRAVGGTAQIIPWRVGAAESARNLCILPGFCALAVSDHGLSVSVQRLPTGLSTKSVDKHRAVFRIHAESAAFGNGMHNPIRIRDLA
jgi:hypothetical protein